MPFQPIEIIEGRKGIHCNTVSYGKHLNIDRSVSSSSIAG